MADRPDGSRPTIIDVARAAGVSKALVSIVMREVPGASAETRRRVKRIAEEIGYVPDQRARKLRQIRSGLLGVVFELQQPFHGDVVEQLYAAAARRGYDVVLSAVAPSRPEDRAVADLMRERCEAAILLGSSLTVDELSVLAAQLPAVVVARQSGAAEVDSVRGDDVAGIALAVDHLVELGHRHIAHIDGGGAAGTADRRRGFVDAMARHGLAAFAAMVSGGLTEADGARGIGELLTRPHRPTAVVAFNDRCATGVLDQLVRRGVEVPGDMSVVGYDDSRLARLMHVQLTTVSQDAAQLAEAAVSAALGRITGGTASDLVLPPHLVVRATTGPAPAA